MKTRQMPYEPLPASVLFAFGGSWCLLSVINGGHLWLSEHVWWKSG
jgi:hypothetical protein